jgi:Sulfotransferase family
MAMPSPSEPPEQTNSERPKVVYVMGAGRSGSTILGVALGNCANMFFAGELNKWLPRSGTPSLADPERVNFWSAIRAELEDASGLFGYGASCLERSSSLFHIRNWPLRRRLRSRYRVIAEELYGAIARRAHVTHVVDTSHYPLRARELQSLAGVDLYLVYLVRDPQSVVASLGRKDVVERSFGMAAANTYLWLTNLLSSYVFLRHPRERRLFVRHEEFCADPEGVVGEILYCVDSPAAVPDMTAALRTGLPLHGNRLTRSELVTVSGRDGAPRQRSPMTTLLQLPWAAVFRLLRPAVAVPHRADVARLDPES